LTRSTFAVVLVAILALSACSTQTNGTPKSHAPTHNSGPTASAAPTGLNCPGPATQAIVSCVLASLDTFWTAKLGRPIAGHMVVDPRPAEVPAGCRSALKLRTAFTCTTGGTVFLTAPYVQRLRNDPPKADAWYRFAETMGHEMGHVVQLAVHDPAIGQPHQTLAASRAVEQQADCLSGVWGASVGLDHSRFVAAAKDVLRIVDDPTERRTHGEPAVRIAAVQRGQAGRTIAACGLTER
jgi:predicted metalloprotease